MSGSIVALAMALTSTLSGGSPRHYPYSVAHIEFDHIGMEDFAVPRLFISTVPVKLRADLLTENVVIGQDGYTELKDSAFSLRCHTTLDSKVSRQFGTYSVRVIDKRKIVKRCLLPREDLCGFAGQIMDLTRDGKADALRPRIARIQQVFDCGKAEKYSRVGIRPFEAKFPRYFNGQYSFWNALVRPLPP